MSALGNFGSLDRTGWTWAGNERTLGSAVAASATGATRASSGAVGRGKAPGTPSVSAACFALLDDALSFTSAGGKAGSTGPEGSGETPAGTRTSTASAFESADSAIHPSMEKTAEGSASIGAGRNSLEALWPLRSWLLSTKKAGRAGSSTARGATTAATIGGAATEIGRSATEATRTGGALTGDREGGGGRDAPTGGPFEKGGNVGGLSTAVGSAGAGGIDGGPGG